MEYKCPMYIISILWLSSSFGFVYCGNDVFKDSADVIEFNQFARQQVLQAVYPLSKKDFKYVVDGTVDTAILSSDDLGTYGCLRSPNAPGFQYMVRKYSQCDLAVLEANPSADRYGCDPRGGNKCELSISSKITYSEQATAGWKVGAKVGPSYLEISTEYGESWTTSKGTEDTVERKVTLDPGQTAVPYVIVAGIQCFAEYHGVLNTLVAKLSAPGSDFEDETMACEKSKTCEFTCARFLNNDLNNNFVNYKIPRECVFNKPQQSLYPVTRDSVVPCRKDKPPFFRGNMTMPLYNKDGKLIKIYIVYTTKKSNIKR